MAEWYHNDVQRFHDLYEKKKNDPSYGFMYHQYAEGVAYYNWKVFCVKQKWSAGILSFTCIMWLVIEGTGGTGGKGAGNLGEWQDNCERPFAPITAQIKGAAFKYQMHCYNKNQGQQPAPEAESSSSVSSSTVAQQPAAQEEEKGQVFEGIRLRLLHCLLRCSTTQDVSHLATHATPVLARSFYMNPRPLPFSMLC